MTGPRSVAGLLSFFIAVLTSMSAWSRGPQSSVEFLQTLPLSDVEGLWSLTSENLLVLILRNGDGRLDISVAPENAGSWKSGSVVGYLEPAADNRSWWLFLEDAPNDRIAEKITGRFPFSRRCIVKLNDQGDCLAIEKGDFSVEFKPLSLLPKLNRLIRLKYKDPKQKLPEGFRKIAPGFDGAVGTRSRPVYF